MGDLICRKTMMRCHTQSMCSPHGGCTPGATDMQWFDVCRALANERDQLKAENEAMRLRIVECNGYLQCVVDQSMSRNNAEALAIELIEGNGKVTDR